MSQTHCHVNGTTTTTARKTTLKQLLVGLLIAHALLHTQAHVIRKRESNNGTTDAAASNSPMDNNMTHNDPDIVMNYLNAQQQQQQQHIEKHNEADTVAVAASSSSERSESASKITATTTIEPHTAQLANERDVMNVMADKLKLQDIAAETEETTIKAIANGRFEATPTAAAAGSGHVLPTKAAPKLAMQHDSNELLLQQLPEQKNASIKILPMEPVSNGVEETTTTTTLRNTVITNAADEQAHGMNEMRMTQREKVVENEMQQLLEMTSHKPETTASVIAATTTTSRAITMTTSLAAELLATTPAPPTLTTTTTAPTTNTPTTMAATADIMQQLTTIAMPHASATTTTTTRTLPTLDANVQGTTEMPATLLEIVTSSMTSASPTTTFIPQQPTIAAMPSANEIVQQATTPAATATTTQSSLAERIAAAAANYTANHSPESSMEMSLNEIKQLATGSGEKRAKFINDNSTNAQQLNLPDTADVWTLAGMKMVPKQNQTQQLHQQQQQQAPEKNEATAEQHGHMDMAANSEKNLLTWTQLMLNGELANGKKKFEKLQLPAAEENDKTAVSADKHGDVTEWQNVRLAEKTLVGAETTGAETHANLAAKNKEISNYVDESVATLTTTTPANSLSTLLGVTTTPKATEHEENKLELPLWSTTTPLTLKFEAEKTATPASVEQMPLLTTTTTARTVTATATLTTGNNDKRTTTLASLSNDNKDNITTTTSTAAEMPTITEFKIYATAMPTSQTHESKSVSESEAQTMTAPSAELPLQTTPATATTTTANSIEAMTTFPKLHASTQALHIEQLPTTTTTIVAQTENDLTLSSIKSEAANANNVNVDVAVTNSRNDNGSAAADVTMRVAESVDETSTLSMLTASELSGSVSARDALLTVNEIHTNASEINESNNSAKTTTTTIITSAANELTITPADFDKIITTTKTPSELTVNKNVFAINEEPQTKQNLSEFITTTIGSATTAIIANEGTSTAAAILTNERLTVTTAATIFDNNNNIEEEKAEAEAGGQNERANEATTPGDDLTVAKGQNEISENVKIVKEINEANEEDKGIIENTTKRLLLAQEITPATTATTTSEATVNKNAIATNLIEAADKDKLEVSATTTTPTSTAVPKTEDEEIFIITTTATTTTTTAGTDINKAQQENQNATGATSGTTAGTAAAGGNKDVTNALNEDEHLAEDNDDELLLLLTTTTTSTTAATTTTTNSAMEIIKTTTTASDINNANPPLTNATTNEQEPVAETSTTTTASIGTKLHELYTIITTTTTPATTSNTQASTESDNKSLEPVTTTTTMLPTLNTSTTFEITTPKHVQMHVLPASAGGAATTASFPTNLQPNATADSGGTDVNVIIAITVSVVGVIALILLVAVLYFMRKRQKQTSYGQRCRPVSLDAYSLDNVSVLGSVRRKGAYRASKRTYGNAAFDDPSLRHNELNAQELAKFVERRSSIFEEFRDVPQIIARVDEVPPGCEYKNRYSNVVPLPETRVILQQQNDDEKSEYINANYVRGPRDPPNYYIACQAPLETTVCDFWRMIWEQQSRVIVQATDLIEDGKEKCAEYLPPSVTLDNHTSYGDFQVTLKNREVKDKYAISTIMLKHLLKDESRELTHYWYKWPETGVPNEEAPIIAMLLEARSSLKTYAIEQANALKEKSSTLTIKSVSETSDGRLTPMQGNSLEKSAGENSMAGSNGEINGNLSAEKLKVTANQGPLTVHCSPGTGRTGTIISCDMAIRSLETPKRSVDIPQLVYYVRRGRASAVQTKEQYEFIYKVAHMYATKITNLSNDN